MVTPPLRARRLDVPKLSVIECRVANCPNQRHPPSPPASWHPRFHSQIRPLPPCRGYRWANIDYARHSPPETSSRQKPLAVPRPCRQATRTSSPSTRPRGRRSLRRDRGRASGVPAPLVAEPFLRCCGCEHEIRKNTSIPIQKKSQEEGPSSGV